MILKPGIDNGIDFRFQPYRPSLIFSNRHISTMYPYTLRSTVSPAYRRERWETSDGDFFDLDFIDKGSNTIVILLHGLEGSSSSQYILGLVHFMGNENYDICAVNHRSCSGDLNRTLGFYHSGFTKDLDQIISTLSMRYEKLAAVGYSLGGNMLLKYLGTHKPPDNFITGIAFSAPVHLSSSAVMLNHWSNRLYTIQFLRTLNKKAVAKAKQFPEKMNPKAFENIATLYEFDNKVTAPLHGFADAEDYYARSSSLQYLQNINVQTLLINALDDSFLAPPCFPFEVADNHLNFHFYASPKGGHVGFASLRSDRYWSDEIVRNWLSVFLK